MFSGTAVTLAENTYDELGRLKTNKKNNQANLNTIYGYNVRSWTKSITSPLFTETLYYNESYGGSLKQYNGNISAMNYLISGEATLYGYSYSYDNLSRLTKAVFLTSGNPNASKAYNMKNITYDKHGNMKTMQLYGKSQSTAYGALVDNLTMTYTGNQMTRVDDAAVAISLVESMDFKNGSNVANEYTYNANGAMNKDLNKGISGIQYNSLNLPRMMDIKSPVAEARNEYTYSASGSKLKVIQKWNPDYNTAPVIGSAINTAALTQTKTTEYIGNIIYENSALKRILIDGGYIEGGVYYYYLSDHLGNNRVVINASGTAIQRNHYYPFGTAFAENTVAEQGKQPYKYNGKELDQMHGLNWYDSNARMYDPVIPRTPTPDPHAENYYAWSPYAWVGNNPIRIIDPTGMDWYQDDKGNVMWQEGNDKSITKTYEGENGSFTTTYKNIGTTYNQRIDDFTFVAYDQNTPNVYYFPDDFQNGDFARNAQISQSPYTMGGADAIGWSFSGNGSLGASGSIDILHYVTFQLKSKQNGLLF